MRNLSLLAAAALWLTAAAHADDMFPTLRLGSPMPPFELPGIDGQIHHSSDWIGKKALVIVFTCDHCPTAQLYEDRIKAIARDYASKSVQLVAIEPNHPSAIRLDELGYTDVSDSFQDMKVRAAYRQFNFPYLYDGDAQNVSKQFGPAATPHAFVLDESRRLRYEGRIDDSPRESLVKRRDLRDAIDAVLINRPVMTPRTPSIGCSTKWMYKSEGRNAEEEKFLKEPVTLADAGVDEMKKLAHNTGGKYTLIDFWATWCGPCVNELPDVVTTWRMYRHRPFDLVTVSTNYPDERKGAQAVLDRVHSSARNFIFGTNENYALMKAFDPDWTGAVPYLVLLAPDGKVVWKYQGETDILTVRRNILANLPDDDYIGQKAYWNKPGPTTGGGL